jgi:hypothetical protein
MLNFCDFLKIFLLEINYFFCVFGLFLHVNVKNNLKK